MTEINYRHSPWPVRGDITAAHKRSWERLGSAGTWLTGKERISIAAEVRNAQLCRLCQKRKESLFANNIEGNHDDLAKLSKFEVEQIHRISTDPGRLSRAWYQQLRECGISEERYVETVGVIATVVAIDTFTRGLGIEKWALPRPLSGSPLRRRPIAAKKKLAWVPTILPEDAVGTPDENLYAGRPTVAHIYQAMSLIPAEVRGFFDLVATQYLPSAAMTDFDKEYRAISHAQIELVAGRVSAINQCVY